MRTPSPSTCLRFLCATLLPVALTGCDSPTACVFTDGATYFYCWQDEERDFCESGGGAFSEATSCEEEGYGYQCTDAEVGPGLEEKWTVASGCDESVPPGGATAANSSNSTSLPQVEWVAGTFTDSRDGQTYPTTTFGGQTWLAGNLAFESVGDYQPIGIGSFGYDDDVENVADFGRLYTWEAASEACPAGWRLPTLDDVRTLMLTLEVEESLASTIQGGTVPNVGAYLMSTDDAYWDSTAGASDLVGFHAVGSGWCNQTVNWPPAVCNDLRGLAGFWTSTEADTSRAFAWYVYPGSLDIPGTLGITGQTMDGNHLLAVRCIAD